MCERYSFWILKAGGILGDPAAFDQSHEGAASDEIRAAAADNAYRAFACRVEYAPDWDKGPLAFEGYRFTLDEPDRPEWLTKDAERKAIAAMQDAILASIPTSGTHTVWRGEFLCVAGDAVIRSVTGGHARAYGSATIQSVTGGYARAYNSATVQSVTGGYVLAYGNATVQSVTGGYVLAYGSATILNDTRGSHDNR